MKRRSFLKSLGCLLVIGLVPRAVASATAPASVADTVDWGSHVPLRAGELCKSIGPNGLFTLSGWLEGDREVIYQKALQLMDSAKSSGIVTLSKMIRWQYCECIEFKIVTKQVFTRGPHVC